MALAVLTVLTLLPARYLTAPVFDWWDKAQHALAFAVLAALAALAWRGALVRQAIGLALYGGLIEVAQYLSGWRSGEWADWGADCLGVIAMALLVALLRQRGGRPPFSAAG